MQEEWAEIWEMCSTATDIDDDSYVVVNPNILTDERIIGLMRVRFVPDAEYEIGFIFLALRFVPIFTKDYIDAKKRLRHIRVCFGADQKFAVFEIGVHARPKYYDGSSALIAHYRICDLMPAKLPSV